MCKNMDKQESRNVHNSAKPQQVTWLPIVRGGGSPVTTSTTSHHCKALQQQNHTLTSELHATAY